MKKRTSILFAILCLIASIFVLQACFDKNGDTPPNGEEEVPTAYFDWSNLNYSANGANSFTVFDEVDLNTIAFDSYKIKAGTVIYEIYFGEEKQKTIYAGAGRLESFALNKIGTYRVEVTAKKAAGGQANEHFEFEVKPNSRPNRVEFVIKNSKGEVVPQPKGGDEYTFIAKIFSGEKEVEADSFFWEQLSNSGIAEYKYKIGNTAKSTVRAFNFNCIITNNMDKKINIMDYAQNKTYIIEDNLDKSVEYPNGIQFSYGINTANNYVQLPLNIGGTSGAYFNRNISIAYRFDNGDVQPIEISQDKKTEGNATLMISYGNGEYGAYLPANYDYSCDRNGKRIANYFANGVKYQFDPTKSSASIKLVIWQSNKREGITYIEPATVDGSVIDVDIISSAPQSIDVKGISGSHKDDSVLFSKTYKTFNRAVKSDTVEVYVCCAMKATGSLSDEYYNKSLSSIKQFFVLDIDIPSSDMCDYTIEYTVGVNNKKPIELRTYSAPALGIFDQYFVCPDTGSSTMTIRSRFGRATKTLTINVVDKLFYNNTEIIRESIRDYGVYYEVDVRNNIRFKDFYLSSYSKSDYNERGINENEVLEYLNNNVVIAPSSLNYANNGRWGQQLVSVRIKGTNIIADLGNIFIIPQFCFAINGTEYIAKELAQKSFYHTTVRSMHPLEKYDTDKDIFGAISYLEYQKGEDEVITRQSFRFIMDYASSQLEGFPSPYNEESPRYRYKLVDNTFVVSYYFFHYPTGDARPNYFEVDILQVHIV